MSEQAKVAVVTGASRGIGKGILLELANAGNIVCGTATSDKGAAAISEYIQAAGVKGKGYKLDVCNPTSITEFISAVTADFGAPEILVNNAGINRDNLLMRMSDDEWNDVISTNLSSVYRLSKACIRSMMKARWGRIINIGSIVGVMGNPGQTNYCAAKAGLIGFSKSLAQEAASRGVTVNVVAPGFIKTDMTDALPESYQEALVKHIPAKRIGQPKEIAAAVAFLASEGASYVTGNTIHVNGGMYMA